MDGNGCRVGVSWQHAYVACQPAAAELLRVVGVLDLTALSSPAAGVAAGLTPDQAADAVGEIAKAGWVEPGNPHPVAPTARRWLTANADSLVAPERATEIIRAFAGYHAEAVDPDRHDPATVGRWLADHRVELLAAVRACDRTGLRPLGTGLAAAVWHGARLVPDPSLWNELAETGERLAVADRDPAILAELLHRDAATFAGQDDRLRAEAQWVRALAIVRRSLRDHPEVPGTRARAAAILSGLADLYRSWGRLSKALDAELELVELRRAAGDPVPTAETLARVAATMYTVGRLNSAADYFAAADEMLAGTDGARPEVVRRHARILEWRGRALWELGQHGGAKRHWSRALAMAIDVDDEFAEHVRALLATAPDRPLPAQEPNTSWSLSGGDG